LSSSGRLWWRGEKDDLLLREVVRAASWSSSRGGQVSRCVSVAKTVAEVQHPWRRPSQSSASARRREAAKWSVPGCLSFAGVCGYLPEGRVRASELR
jgi:hypothetical protein